MSQVSCQPKFPFCCDRPPIQTTDVAAACRPPYSSCKTPQTKRELLGVRYAVQGVDATCQEDELAPLPPIGPLGLTLPSMPAQNSPNPPPPMSPTSAHTTPTSNTASAAMNSQAPLSRYPTGTPACGDHTPAGVPQGAPSPDSAEGPSTAEAASASKAGSESAAGVALLSSASLDSNASCTTTGPHTALTGFEALPCSPETAASAPARAPLQVNTAPTGDARSLPASPAAAKKHPDLAPTTSVRRCMDAAVPHVHGQDKGSTENAVGLLSATDSPACAHPAVAAAVAAPGAAERHSSRREAATLPLPRASADPGSAQVEAEGMPKSKSSVPAVQLVEEDALSKWVQLPNRGHKGRAHVETLSPERPWKVVPCPALSCYALFCLTLPCPPCPALPCAILPCPAFDKILLMSMQPLIPPWLSITLPVLLSSKLKTCLGFCMCLQPQRVLVLHSENRHV